MPREAVTTVAAPTSPAERFAGLKRGDYAATVLQEPWITVAEKAGCRLVSTTFFHGTWVATPDTNPEAYAALLRGITWGLHRINADKRRYVSYFKRDWAGHPEVDALSPDDFNLGRIQVKEPTTIPESEGMGRAGASSTARSTSLHRSTGVWSAKRTSWRRRCQRLQPHEHGRHVRGGRPRHDRRVELHLAPVRCELPGDLRIRLEVHDGPHAVVLEREVEHAFYQ